MERLIETGSCFALSSSRLYRELKSCILRSVVESATIKVEGKTARVLIIYFSLSGQSRGLVNLFAAGLKQEGIQVTMERIQAQTKITFPFRGMIHTIRMMLTTFLQFRIKIKAISNHCFKDYDLIILGGPTWSYNPSGPVLSCLDLYGAPLFRNRRVLPLISCRGYFRIHNFFLRRRLKTFGALLEESIIFSHPVNEPWSSLGVFLKSSGYQPEKMNFLKNHYSHFGHSTEQLVQAQALGNRLGKKLKDTRRQ